MKIWRIINKNFYLTASTLAIASGFSQVNSIINLIVINILFTQEDFGLFSVFLSYIAILGTMVTLSFEKSIPNIKKEEVKLMIFGLFFVALSVSSMCCVGLLIINYKYALLVSCILFFGAIMSTSELTNIRNKQFGLLSFSKAFPNILFLLVLLVYKIMGVNSFESLILGYSVSYLIFVTVYGIVSLKEYIVDPPNLSDIILVLRRERKFVLIALSNGFNRLAYNLPTILIEKYFGAGLAGQYNIMLRFGMSPVGMIAGAFNQVYHGKLADQVRNKSQEIFNQYKSIRNKLLLISILYIVLVLFLFPFVVRIVLGDEWEMAICFLKISAPLFGIMLFVSPLGSAFFVFNAQMSELVFQFSYFLIAFISFLVGIVFSNLILAISLFSGLSFIRYIFIYLRIHELHKVP